MKLIIGHTWIGRRNFCSFVAVVVVVSLKKRFLFVSGSINFFFCFRGWCLYLQKKIELNFFFFFFFWLLIITVVIIFNVHELWTEKQKRIGGCCGDDDGGGEESARARDDSVDMMTVLQILKCIDENTPQRQFDLVVTMTIASEKENCITIKNWINIFWYSNNIVVVYPEHHHTHRNSCTNNKITKTKNTDCSMCVCVQTRPSQVKSSVDIIILLHQGLNLEYII